MNFMKRAVLGITRRLGKSFILLAVIFILGNVISGAISIQQATGNVEETIKERLGPAATVEMDWEAYDKMSESEMMNFDYEYVDVDLIKKIGETSHVRYYDYNVTTSFQSKILIDYNTSTDESGEIVTSSRTLSYGDKEEYKFEYAGDFTMKGIYYAPVLDFEEGKGKLVDGRVFTQDEIDNNAPVVIISKKVAEKNNLHVGDKIVLNTVVSDYDDETKREVEATIKEIVLEVIGLFEQQKAKEDKGDIEVQEGVWKSVIDDEYLNTMYVSNELVIANDMIHLKRRAKIDPELSVMLEDNPDELVDYQPMYILNSPDDVGAFEQEVSPLLPKLHKVSSATEQYDSIAGPIQSMSKLAKYVLLVAVAATILITGLVVLLFLRDRKHELGIYLSLGESRGRVVGQILMEIMVLAVIGITVSLFSGNVLAGQVSDTLMKTDDSQSEYLDDLYFDNNIIHIDLREDDVIGSYEVGLNSSYVIGFYVVGLLTILISTVIPLIYIVRLNPKRILM